MEQLVNTYKQCADVCQLICLKNSPDGTGFVLYKYINLEELYNIAVNKKYKSLNIFYPTSKQLCKSKYEAMWKQGEDLNIVADFATIYLTSNNLNELLYTLPVWDPFRKRVMNLFKNIRVSYVNF